MKLSTDHTFHIGHQHLRNGDPCQDFALSGILSPELAFAAVSDGCSTGGMTDVGSRLICLQIRRHLAECMTYSVGVDGQLTHYKPASMMAALRTALPLRMEDWLATSMHMAVDRRGLGYIHIQGDGAFAVQQADGNGFVTRLDWAGNMPAYPAYSLDGYEEYIKAQGGDIAAPRLTAETWAWCEGEFVFSNRREVPLSEGIRGYSYRIDASDTPGLRYAAIFSDGITQVEGKEWYEVAHDLLAFKSTAGSFAKRRLHRFLTDAYKLGRGPQDDIAYAVIHIEPEEENAPV